MKCSEIAQKIEKLDPVAGPIEVSRMCTLLSSAIDDRSHLVNDEFFLNAWQDINLRLAAATDQHAAVTGELEQLAESDPAEFSKDQIWVLVRAIKIQSQVLRMYIGDSELDAN